MEGNQQSEINELRYKKTRQPLVRYVKDPLVKYVKLQVVCSVLFLAFILMLIFVPMFSIDFEALDIDESVFVSTLPKISAILESEEVSKISFSIFDELRLMFTSFDTMADADVSVVEVVIDCILQIIAFIFCLVATVAAIKNLVKNFPRSCYTLSAYSIYNYSLNNYGEEAIAEIMNNPQTKMEKVSRVMDSSLFASLMVAVLEFICMIINASINSAVINKMIENLANGKITIYPATSYMSYMTGVNVWMNVLIIIAVLVIVLSIYSLKLKADLQEQIALSDAGYILT